MRSTDYNAIKEVTKQYPEMFSNENIEAWVNNRNNIMLEHEGSIALFTYEYPGVYTGHYLFSVKGKEAIELSHKMLNEIFKVAVVIRGETPVEKKAARWMSRKVGFTSLGIFDDHELFYLNKEDFKHG